MILPPGGFLVLGLLIAARRRLQHWSESRQPAGVPAAAAQ
jgi:electron transport complex protein RnfE